MPAYFMEVTKLTNITLNVGETTLPFIRVVLKDYDIEMSASDVNSLIREIYERVKGMVTTTSYFTNDPAAFLNVEAGTHITGYSTGFQVRYRVQGTPNRFYSYLYTGSGSGTGQTGVFYNNTLIASGQILTGYSTYEYGFIFILTDENYNLLIPASSSYGRVEGITVRQSSNLGATLYNNNVVCVVADGDIQSNISRSWKFITSDNIKNDIHSETDPTKTDPFGPGGESETGGGTGDFDGTSDPIDFPNLPTLSATDAGFITLFNPSATQLKSLASYMWSNNLFDLDTWKKIFADPMDAILGLTIVPVNVPTGGSGPVKVGNISTDVNMTYAATQYVEVDCGTLNVNEYWGAYLDYEPFTKAEIYLPYIGTHAIAVDDIMGKEVHVKYHIDILSGACAAYVKCGDSVLYTFIGQCASSIPITGSDMTNVINGVISAAVSIGTMVATGGASAPVSVPALANTAVNQMKPSIEKSGSMSGTGGMLGIQTPYLILTRPRQCLPASQNAFMGYPSFISSVMGDLTGYTEVEQVHLDGIAATDAEITEIENLLKSGVIF